MNPNRYFVPIMRENPMMYMNQMVGRNMLNFRNASIFDRLGNGIKSFNWKGLFNGVNKTLNVVNQTIPLVRQAKPMYDNVKSMVKLTKAFRSETNNTNKSDNIPVKNISQVKNTNSNINMHDENKPSFFI